jgi:hypothetical protein
VPEHMVSLFVKISPTSDCSKRFQCASTGSFAGKKTLLGQSTIQSTKCHCFYTLFIETNSCKSTHITVTWLVYMDLNECGNSDYMWPTILRSPGNNFK